MGSVDDSGQIDVDRLDVRLSQLYQRRKSHMVSGDSRVRVSRFSLTEISLGKEHLRVRLADPGVGDDDVEVLSR